MAAGNPPLEVDFGADPLPSSGLRSTGFRDRIYMTWWVQEQMRAFVADLIAQSGAPKDTEPQEEPK